MNLATLPLGNPRHHIGKLKGFAYLLFEAFMRACFEFRTLRVSSGCCFITIEVQVTSYL